MTKEVNVNDKDLFENFCLSPGWQTTEVEKPFIRQSKDMATLLSELEEIKENLHAVQEKQWHLANLMRFHQEGFEK